MIHLIIQRQRWSIYIHNNQVRIMNIVFHRNFKKAYKKLLSSSRKKFDKRLIVFIDNPFDASLRNHQLTGKYRGYRSIDITGDIRAIYEPVDDNTALFITIGTHSKLY